MPVTYEEAGVSVERGYEAVRRMKAYAEATFDQNVLQSLGSFGGMYALGEQVLVSGTDGVGTKLKAAFALEQHDTVGIDCVAMCANDVVCHGAKPLFFLDYIATGKLVPEVAASIVKGVAAGCTQAGCALIGGETAEMPGFYPIGEYDLAGFCVGLVERAKLIDNSRVQAGDVILALASSGVHSNGFSLVRKLIPMERVKLVEYSAELGKTLGEELLIRLSRMNGFGSNCMPRNGSRLIVIQTNRKHAKMMINVQLPPNDATLSATRSDRLVCCS